MAVRKSTIKKNQQKMLKEQRNIDPFEHLSDAEVLAAMHTRFEVMGRMTKGAVDGDIRGLIISGAPGIGKTYTVEEIVKWKKHNFENFNVKVIKGTISPVNLFKVLQDYRKKGDVVVIDDADSIFYDDVGVALLKGALDSGDERWISWLAESNALRADGVQVYDNEFLYEGQMIFITNTDFQHFVDQGKSKLVPHFAALMSRTIYLDLMVHTTRAIGIWIHYIIRKTNMLIEKYGISKEQQQEALNYIMENKEIMRTLSLRDAMKIGQMMKTDPDYWQDLADVTLLREIRV